MGTAVATLSELKRDQLRAGAASLGVATRDGSKRQKTRNQLEEECRLALEVQQSELCSWKPTCRGEYKSRCTCGAVDGQGRLGKGRHDILCLAGRKRKVEEAGAEASLLSSAMGTVAKVVGAQSHKGKSSKGSKSSEGDADGAPTLAPTVLRCAHRTVWQ